MPTVSRPRVSFPDLATFIAKTGITQMEIAAAVGVSQAALSRYVTGAHIPRPAIAQRLARFANIPLDSFVRTRLKRTA
jgi:transcriptional regulator with XRE-family HTH domain